MTSMFDYDDSVNLAYNAKMAGKNLVAAKHELLNKTGEFLFLAHSDREFALRCQMVERDIEGVAHRRLASLSDSKAKLVRAAYDEWNLRHTKCAMCKTAEANVIAIGHSDGCTGNPCKPGCGYFNSPTVGGTPESQVEKLRGVKDLHHVECIAGACHPECRVQLPAAGVQSAIHKN